jgi:hypothetical protein
MVLDPANPQPDESATKSLQTFGALVPGLVSIAATLALALLVSRTRKKNEASLPDTTASNIETNAGAQITVAKGPDATKKSEPDSPVTVVLNPSIPSQPFPIDIKPNGIDYGGLIIGIVSLVVTLYLANLAAGINQSLATSAQAQANAAAAQATAAKAQAAAADDEVNTKFIQEFRERINELSLPTEDPDDSDYDANLMRKSLATIALAQYGERALPALKMALEAKDSRLRDGAVDVLAQMLSNQDAKSREKVFSALMEYFAKGNLFIRVEILKTFIKAFSGLSDTEVKTAKDIFRKHIVPDADVSETRSESELLLIEAAQFFGNSPSCDSAEFLLAIAKNQSCGNGPQEQARNSLRAVAKNSCDLRPELQEQIEAVLGIKK